jgi:molecular chaperone GrpE
MSADDLKVTEVEAEVAAEELEGPSAAAAAPDGEQPGAQPDDLRARLEEAEAKRDEYLGDLQRVAADFDNYRKRMAREQEALFQRAGARLVEKLLPVLDDLERALDAAEHHEEAKVIEGVRLTRSTLWNILSSEGIAEIEADGAFDPHVHEALMSQPAEDVESGAILQVLQKGYRLGDVVVRPARVVVAE